MSTVSVKRGLKDNTLEATIALSIVGYALVIGTFVLDLPIYPELSEPQVNVFSHAIALINLATTICLATGWYFIRAGQVDRHRKAMTASFGLILLFLVVYLTRVGGGEGTKVFVGPELVTTAYQIMLGIHILLSILAVPLVLYAFLLGITRTPHELRQSNHARVGRVAAGTWLLSLVLGVVTYLMLDHIYAYEFGMVLLIALG